MNEKINMTKLGMFGAVMAIIGVVMLIAGSTTGGIATLLFGAVIMLRGEAKTTDKIGVGVSTEKKDAPVKNERGAKIVLGILMVIMAVITFSSFGSDSSSTSATQQPAQNTISPEAKQNAQKELDELIDLSKQANLVSSYEFSSTANVVYIDYAWYTQDVTFKKDFMAKIATLKKTITGYQHFELRDRRSDEKVAEVTAFGGGLEVYK
jgi:hypothetical protein